MTPIKRRTQWLLMKGAGAVSPTSHEGRAPTSILLLQPCKRGLRDIGTSSYHLSSVQFIANNNVIDFVPVVDFTLPRRSLTACPSTYCVEPPSSGPALASACDWSSSQVCQGRMRRR